LRREKEAVVGIAEVISALNLVLNVFKTGRTALRERKDGDLLSPSLLAKTHEKLQYLRESVRGLRRALLSNEVSTEDYEDWKRLLQAGQNFFISLRSFIVEVKRLNLSVLSIYDREMANQLAQAFRVDEALYEDLQARVEYDGPKQGLKPPTRDLNKLYELNDRFRVLYGDINVVEDTTLDELMAPYSFEQTREVLVPQLSTLEELLEKFSEQLATFIRINWQPKDLS
jgi:hypothetical protein